MTLKSPEQVRDILAREAAFPKLQTQAYLELPYLIASHGMRAHYDRMYRDYPGSKDCTSPFAPIWIKEIMRRQGNPSNDLSRITGYQAVNRSRHHAGLRMKVFWRSPGYRCRYALNRWRLAPQQVGE
jgi:hypothetical protein